MISFHTGRTLPPRTVEKFLEKQPLIIDRIGPVGSVVNAGTHRVVMLDAPLAERLVQFVVHVEKEVVVAAVDHQRQIAVRYAV